jgi:4-hydroxy-3-polyprenylbenzoate decarboxylase
MTTPQKRIVVAITGASGAIMGYRMLELLSKIEDIEVHLVMSEAARFTLNQETNHTIKEARTLADHNHEPHQIGAPLASGSFHHDGMIVLPCSIKSLSDIAQCHSADLISRSADVSIKEGRPLLLAVRETPIHQGHLRLMSQASEMGAIIYPPVLGFYSGPQTLEEAIDHLLGRMLQRIGIPTSLFKVWLGPQPSLKTEKNQIY